MLAALGVMAMLIASSCAPQVDTDAVAKELTRLDTEWSKAALAKDVDKVASFYAADAVVYPPDAPVVHGQAAAKQAWASIFSEPTFTLSWKTEYAHAAKSGELGVTAGSYEDSFRGPDGAMVVQKGKYLCTWEKQADGSWKAAHDMWNSDAK
jgi:ketosteroid isomerase-like protein